MKNIIRHEIDLGPQEWGYNRLLKSLPQALEKLKKNKKIKLIYSRASDSFLKALVLSKPEEATNYLRIAYKALYYDVKLKTQSGKELKLVFDDIEPVLMEAEESEIEDDDWLNLFNISLILRISADWLFDIPKDKIKNPNSTTNFRAIYNYLIFEYLYSKNQKEKEEKFEEADKMIRGYNELVKPIPHPQGYYYLFLRRHWLWVARTIEQKNQEEFTIYLTKALEDHQQFYSQKKGIDKAAGPLCDEPKGFMSLPLTALCALAFDKGMKIEVESDYIPKDLYEGKFLKG